MRLKVQFDAEELARFRARVTVGLLGLKEHF